jgi:hypothetical protein
MTSIFEQPELRSALRDPVDRTAVADLTPEHARFAGGRTYPCIDGRPILVDETSSLFATEGMQPSTHRHAYRDRKKLINVVRSQLVPGPTWNPEYAARIQALADAARGQPVLVIGRGDRVDEYRQRFAGSRVVSSDLHLQYGADVGIDAHPIPFADRLSLSWLKYLDARTTDSAKFHPPKGVYVTVQVDGVARGDRELIAEVTRLVRHDIEE